MTSAFAALGVGKLSAMWGLPGVLGVAAVVLGGSVVFGEAAYSIAEKVSKLFMLLLLLLLLLFIWFVCYWRLFRTVYSSSRVFDYNT